MIIEPFRTDDTTTFLALAAAEGWVAEPWEFDFLQTAFPHGCFCARDNSGKGIAFVTSLKHGQSGWIGNLIVEAGYRGKGVGEALFIHALHALHDAGAETCWLTASKSGKSLYEKHGFSRIDTIVRWTGLGRRYHGENGLNGDHGHDEHDASVSAIDCQAWGDRRDALLDATVGRGRLLLKESGFLVIQPCGAAMQFGPLSALDDNTAEELLDTAFNSIPHTTKIYLDAPAGNRAATRCFNRKRLFIAGTNELMYAGIKPAYRPEFLYGLATMGSCG